MKGVILPYANVKKITQKKNNTITNYNILYIIPAVQKYTLKYMICFATVATKIIYY